MFPSRDHLGCRFNKQTTGIRIKKNGHIFYHSLWAVRFQRNQQGQVSSETKAIPRNLNLWQRFSFVFLHFSISKIKAIHCISEQGSVNGSVLEHFLSADSRPLDIVRQCCRSDWLAEVNNEVDNRGSREQRSECNFICYWNSGELWQRWTRGSTICFKSDRRMNNEFAEQTVKEMDVVHLTRWRLRLRSLESSC